MLLVVGFGLVWVCVYRLLLYWCVYEELDGMRSLRVLGLIVSWCWRWFELVCFWYFGFGFRVMGFSFGCAFVDFVVDLGLVRVRGSFVVILMVLVDFRFDLCIGELTGVFWFWLFAIACNLVVGFIVYLCLFVFLL